MEIKIIHNFNFELVTLPYFYFRFRNLLTISTKYMRQKTRKYETRFGRTNGGKILWKSKFHYFIIILKITGSERISAALLCFMY